MTVRLSKRYGFTASHRLHSAQLSDEDNRTTYGKCDNPFGHGHNYEVELTVRGTIDAVTGRVIDLQRLDRVVGEQILIPFGYKDLNREVPAFQRLVPTTENLTAEVDARLRVVWADEFGPAGPALEKVRIWETDRNICEITEIL